jgi:hypothetical protein
VSLEQANCFSAQYGACCVAVLLIRFTIFTAPPPPAAAAPVDDGPKVKDDPVYIKYFKLIRMGMPMEGVKIKCAAVGDNPDLLDHPDAPIAAIKDPSLISGGAAPAAAAPAAPGAPPSAAADGTVAVVEAPAAGKQPSKQSNQASKQRTKARRQ